MSDGKRYDAFDAPASNGAAVTPDDDTDLSTPCRCLYVGETGDIVLITLGGQTLTFVDVPVGILPVRATRVKATGTTADSIVALW